MADVWYVVLTVAVFALLALVARLVERLLRDDPVEDAARDISTRGDGAANPMGAVGQPGAAGQPGRLREAGLR